MKCVVFSIAIFISTQAVYSQSSVGVGPAGLPAIRSYRLPAFGYSNFTLNLSGDHSGVRHDNASDRDRTTLFLQPSYNRFFQSEKRRLTLNSSLDYSYNRSKRTSQDGSEQVDKDNSFSLFLDGSLNAYSSKNYFFAFSGSGRYSRFDADGDAFESTREDAQIVGGLGIGLGRIRSVTPVIRALRLRERLRSLANGRSLTAEQVQTAAEIFTSESQYSNTYDRPEKYFWNAFSEAMPEAFQDLSFFDAFYLADVLVEQTGLRQEGFEILLEGKIEYDMTKFENENTGARTQKSLLAGPSIMIDYYHNFTARYQLRLYGLYWWQKELQDEVALEWQSRLEVGSTHLYNITDRMLWRASIIYSARKSDFASSLSLEDRTFRIFNIFSSVDFFVENNLSLFASVRYATDNTSIPSPNSDTRRSWALSVGGRFFIGRFID